MDTLTLFYILLIILSVALIAVIVYVVKSLPKMREQNWKRGAIPTKEEIDNEKVIELAIRLQGIQTKKR